MKKLAAAQQKEMMRLSSSLDVRKNDVSQRIADFNTKIQELIDEFNSEISQIVQSYNDVASEANAFVEEVKNAQQEYYDERSEKWQESDRGSEYQDWMNEWDIEIEEVEVEEAHFDEIDEPDIDLEVFEALPTSVDD